MNPPATSPTPTHPRKGAMGRPITQADIDTLCDNLDALLAAHGPLNRHQCEIRLGLPAQLISAWQRNHGPALAARGYPAKFARGHTAPPLELDLALAILTAKDGPITPGTRLDRNYIAHVAGCSHEAIRQIENKALRKIRHLLYGRPDLAHDLHATLRTA